MTYFPYKGHSVHITTEIVERHTITIDGMPISHNHECPLEWVKDLAKQHIDRAEAYAKAYEEIDQEDHDKLHE